MSSSLLDSHLITLSDMKLLTPPIVMPKFFHTFRIEITDNNQKVLKSAKGLLGKNQVVWHEQIPLDVTLKSTIIFKILKTLVGRTRAIGGCTVTIFSLLDMQQSAGICKIDLGAKTQLSFAIKESCVKEVLVGAIQQIENIHLNEGPEMWPTFIAYFQVLKNELDMVTELSPHVHQAWSVLSTIPTIIQMHLTRNSSINGLVVRLTDIYKFIIDAKRLPSLTTTQSNNLKLLIQQTCECAYLINEYVQKKMVGKIWKGPVVDNKIQSFKTIFDRIFNAIQNSLVLETSIITLRVSDSVRELNDRNLLEEMPYSQNAGFSTEKTCLLGTRQKLINEILEWVNDYMRTSRIFVLDGQAGMGKSSVAHTIAEIFRTHNRLGSLFCFSRSDKDRRNLLFSTISRDLADGDVSWRQRLVEAAGRTATRKSLDPVTQFNELIIKPSKDVGTIGPVVIVIDALDESGDRTEREILLNLLFGRSSELPKNYRLIITSRPEPDIELLYQHPNVFCKHMARVDSHDTMNDIQQFISSKLSSVAKVLNAEEKDWRSLLAEKAQGLFQWANLACLFINPTVPFGLAERLRIIISESPSTLYELYHQILDNQPEFQADDYFSTFQIIIGAIVVARRPLSITGLQAFFEPATKDVEVALRPFHSLFIGIDDPVVQIRPLHTSLFDFFTSTEQKPGSPNRYYIDTSNQGPFTHACLRLMNKLLRFNICGLETSHQRNEDIPNFSSRVNEAIPAHLSYACCFWAYHLESSRLESSNLLEEIRDLMHNNLLYFFEALSLLGEVEHGCIGLRILEREVKDTDNQLAAQAADAWCFGMKFAEMMMESTPHLYLSALPFTPDRSFIFKQFIHRYPQLLKIEAGQSVDSRFKDSIVKRHPSNHASSLAFSPQGGQIATGFKDGEFWVWDCVTGKIVYQWKPRETTAGAICSAVFSREGELVYCCFNDGSVQTWNAKTNKIIHESWNEVTRGKCRYCTISSDGRYIAFELENTVVLYNRQTRSKLINEECRSNSTTTFSPNGSLFVFHRLDRVTRLWNNDMQNFISLSIIQPWKLRALTNNYIVAFLYGSLVYEIWDLRTNQKVSRFKEDDESGRFSFSPDEKYLLHFHETTYSIWKTETGGLIIRRFLGWHPRAIVVSPNSNLVALGGNDHTTRVLTWDALIQEKTLVQDKDLDSLSEDDYNARKTELREVWLKGRYLLLLIVTRVGDSFQILDTTKKNKFNVKVRYPIAVSPDDDHWSIAHASSRGLCLWDINAKRRFILDATDRRISSLAFSSTGNRLIDGDSEGSIKVWDVRSRQLISVGGLSGPTEGVLALAFSSMDITFLVAYKANERVFIEEQECVSRAILKGPFVSAAPRPLLITSIAFSFNDTRIVCRSGSHLETLDASTGVSELLDTQHTNSKLSPDRKYLAWVSCETRDKNVVKLWDLEGQMTLYGPSFSHSVMNIAFSTDSTRLSILHGPDKRNGRIDFWDIGSGRPAMRSLQCETAYRFSSHVILRGESLLLASKDGSCRLWDLRVHEIMSSLYDDHLNKAQFGLWPAVSGDANRSIEDHRSSGTIDEALEYALIAWNRSGFSHLTRIKKNGWVLGPRGELLFWVPEGMRKHLWLPCMTYTTEKEFAKLNFNKFVHGTRWKECSLDIDL